MKSPWMQGPKRTLPDFECVTCGVVFRPATIKSKYCSRKCVGSSLPIIRTKPTVPISDAMKPIPGLTGYFITEFGDVYSSRRCDTGFVRKVRCFPNSRGYSSFNAYISPGSSVRKQFFVHACVLLSFVGPGPAGTEGCHNDGNRMNPRLDNLRWDTRSSNHADKIGHGTAPLGERHPMAKLTDIQAEELRQRFSRGESAASLAKHFGITCGHAYDIAARRSRPIDYTNHDLLTRQNEQN